MMSTSERGIFQFQIFQFIKNITGCTPTLQSLRHAFLLFKVLFSYPSVYSACSSPRYASHLFPITVHIRKRERKSAIRGNGEENDWCQRALKAGWRNLHLPNCFVYHAGGVSFGAEQQARVDNAQALLAQKHPRYAADVETYLAADPARQLRGRALLALVAASSLPRVLMISHKLGGGAQQTVSRTCWHRMARVRGNPPRGKGVVRSGSRHMSLRVCVPLVSVSSLIPSNSTAAWLVRMTWPSLSATTTPSARDGIHR